ncbi:RPC4 polymerase, partial [Polypterus senegalus]|nr:DNA-directed RNA polymerase III subunit RPC4 [Polypterus senegalus]XP_039624514.1 DNA-directed RNA polymerase III subunit RPC4 [Polypterus senegalus]XP_039624515.1 DNA-directed RNA polymerase III subunit RPC4 [Polypterus senegalus]MBN3292124.1 RPC4 polymerase [Polypterus senegalus]
MSEGSSGDPGTPGGCRPSLSMGRGLLGRRPSVPTTSNRLPSIRSRDLTLGGVKKKTFTPNIISRRVKEESKDDESRKKQAKERDRDRLREGRGRGRGRANVIQSHSIFEQGPSESMVRKRGEWDSTKDVPNMGPSPIINIKKEKRETEEETKEILRMLERDNFLDDPRLHNDIRSCPVQLPLAVSGWLFKEESKEEEEPKGQMFKKEEVEDMELETPLVKVKQEPLEESVLKTGPLCKAPPLPPSVGLPELLDSWAQCKEEELIFLHLPDSLPGQPPTQDQRPVKGDVQMEDGQALLVKSDKTQDVQQLDNMCSLKDLAEGQVGKLLVRRSGRVQLVLGKVSLDVAIGTQCSFLQELVSVSVGESRVGDLTVLGHIKHKLVCSPDFETLLQHRQ